VASAASHTESSPFSVRPFDRISALRYLGGGSIFMVGGVHAQHYYGASFSSVPTICAPGNGPAIELARSNLAISWSDDYAGLLELAEACDVPVSLSRRADFCHN
jgi:hypothetical protein